MNWKETVLKQKNIKWKRPSLKYFDDGNIDLIINIPITKLMEKQAHWAFLCGVQQVLLFYAKAQEENRVIDEAQLATKFTEWGLGNIWKIAKRG